MAVFRQEILPFCKISRKEQHFRDWHPTCHAVSTLPISEEVYTL
jgi:hypothetical protein